MISIEGLERQAGTYRLEIERAVISSGLNLVVGANGAGKTTLIEMLTTLQPPTRATFYTADGRQGTICRSSGARSGMCHPISSCTGT